LKIENFLDKKEEEPGIEISKMIFEMLESITVKYLENHPTDMQFYHFFESISKKINGQQLYLCLNMLANVFA